MKRTAVNSADWSIPFELNQGELVEGQTRTLYCSGQTAIGDDGQAKHADDFRAQADMTFANVVRMTIFTTDTEAALS